MSFITRIITLLRIVHSDVEGWIQRRNPGSSSGNYGHFSVQVWDSYASPEIGDQFAYYFLGAPLFWTTQSLSMEHRFTAGPRHKREGICLLN